MSNSILYYPTIEFRHEDYQWLWNAALFADKIYRIVPPGYELNEPRNIRELCSTGEIGIPLSPVPYSKEASEELNETRFSNIFIEKRVSSRLESLERSGLFLFAAFLYLLQNSQNSKLIFLCKVVI